MFFENHQTAANRNKSQLKYIVHEIGVSSTIELLAAVLEAEAQAHRDQGPPELQKADVLIKITEILHRIKIKFFDSGVFQIQGEGVPANERRLSRHFLTDTKGMMTRGDETKLIKSN